MNRKLALIPAAIVGLMFLSGCETFGFEDGASAFENLNKVVETGKELEGKAYDGIAKGVDNYCSKVPAAIRSRVRAEINDRTTKGDVEFCIPEAGE